MEGNKRERITTQTLVPQPRQKGACDGSCRNRSDMLAYAHPVQNRPEMMRPHRDYHAVVFSAADICQMHSKNEGRFDEIGRPISPASPPHPNIRASPLLFWPSGTQAHVESGKSELNRLRQPCLLYLPRDRFGVGLSYHTYSKDPSSLLLISAGFCSS